LVTPSVDCRSRDAGQAQADGHHAHSLTLAKRAMPGNHGDARSPQLHVARRKFSRATPPSMARRGVGLTILSVENRKLNTNEVSMFLTVRVLLLPLGFTNA